MSDVGTPTEPFVKSCHVCGAGFDARALYWEHLIAHPGRNDNEYASAVLQLGFERVKHLILKPSDAPGAGGTIILDTGPDAVEMGNAVAALQDRIAAAENDITQMVSAPVEEARATIVLDAASVVAETGAAAEANAAMHEHDQSQILQLVEENRALRAMLEEHVAQDQAARAALAHDVTHQATDVVPAGVLPAGAKAVTESGDGTPTAPTRGRPTGGRAARGADTRETAIARS